MPSFQNLFFQSNPQMHDPAFSVSFVLFLFFFFFIVLLLSFFSFSLHKTSLKHSQPGLTRNPEDSNPTIPSPVENNPTHVPLSEVSPSDSAKDATFVDDKHSDPDPNSSGESVKKKKKRKAKKKKVTSVAENDGFEERENSGSGIRIESAWLYPFTSSSSAMQRRIKQQYDELVQCNESRKLKLAQVVQFANSLVEARGELQHKADVIRRKFVITKALLCKAERSSFDRLRQQIYKLELEQKRLEEDASVYNWLQQQLKLSPAYKKMLEIGASMEKEKSFELVERRYDEFADISFEELLAQEKKDSFWQKSGKSKLCSS